MNFPSTPGAYHTTYNGFIDAFVSRLDPSETGSAQLVYSTFLGASNHDSIYALSVDASGVVTVAGSTGSTNFPTTPGAYDGNYNGAADIFVSRLDPSLVGSPQLVYSTFLGGSADEVAGCPLVDPSGVVTIAGHTGSSDFPTTRGAFDTTYNGGSLDICLIQLDPSRTGNAQLRYSTFLGGSDQDLGGSFLVHHNGAVTVCGTTQSSDFPTTSGAWSPTYLGGVNDAFITQLDMLPTGVSAYGRCPLMEAIRIAMMPSKKVRIGMSAVGIG